MGYFCLGICKIRESGNWETHACLAAFEASTAPRERKSENKHISVRQPHTGSYSHGAVLKEQPASFLSKCAHQLPPASCKAGFSCSINLGRPGVQNSSAGLSAQRQRQESAGGASHFWEQEGNRRTAGLGLKGYLKESQEARYSEHRPP